MQDVFVWWRLPLAHKSPFSFLCSILLPIGKRDVIILNIQFVNDSIKMLGYLCNLFFVLNETDAIFYAQLILLITLSSFLMKLMLFSANNYNPFYAPRILLSPISNVTPHKLHISFVYKLSINLTPYFEQVFFSS